jgi:hypothetical protein
MTIEEVLDIYKTGYQVCKALGVSKQNFTRWAKTGFIPYRQQVKLELLTEGKLKANLNEFLTQLDK